MGYNAWRVFLSRRQRRAQWFANAARRFPSQIARTDYDQANRPCQTELRDTSTGEALYKTSLKYDKLSNLEQFAERAGGETHTSKYTYDRDNRVTEIQYDGAAQKVSYAYDDLGRVTTRTAECGTDASKLTSAYEYVDGGYGTNSTTPLVKKITQNGISFEYAYDSRGNIISEKRNGVETTYAHDSLGQLIRVNDPNENATWVYNYDRGGNILSKAKYAYTTGALGTAVETIPYTYGDANWKDKLTAYNGVPITYDAIGNPLNDGTRTYTWSAGRQLRHISMLTGEAHGFRASNGVHEGSNTILRIVHDEASSRLKVKLLRDGREITDKCVASMFAWTKNGAAAGTGREIAVSDAEVNGDVQFGCSYTETQGVYGTVSVDNNLVASHDPAATDANHVFTLENGMLKVEAPDNAGSSADYALNAGTLSINPGFTGTIAAAYEFTTAPTREIEFKYDHNGLRTQKKVTESGVTTTYDYTLHGKLITHLTKRTVDESGAESTEELHFFYDAQSRPAFVEYNGVKYRYVHNLQGDIVGIVDNTGNLVVEYLYDAWGKPLSIIGTLKTSLGELNLFRYRGYVHDEESALYYLRSRYYIPAIGRFVTADEIQTSYSSVLHNNLYCYCLNNPIILADSEGRFAVLAIGLGSLLTMVAEVLATAIVYIACAAITVAATVEVTDAITEAVQSHSYEHEQSKQETIADVTTQTQSQNKEQGTRKKDTTHMHHIVAQNAWKAAPARTVLQRYGISVQDSSNLVPVPAEMHARLHTTSYYAMVNSRILSAGFRGRGAVLFELRKLNRLIETASILYHLS